MIKKKLIIKNYKNLLKNLNLVQIYKKLNCLLIQIFVIKFIKNGFNFK